MKKAFRIALGSAVLAGGLAVMGASPANAQVRFEGSFPLPHGRISIGVGDVGFGVGSYVPYGYDVYEDPDYGYGFEYEDQWYPCEEYGTRSVIVDSPVYYGHRDYGYVRPYRSHGYGYSQPYHRYDYRTYGRDDYRRWDHRSYRRNDRWSRDRDWRWRR